MYVQSSFKPENPPDGWEEWMGDTLVKDETIYLNARFVPNESHDNVVLQRGVTFAPAGWVIDNTEFHELARYAKAQIFSSYGQLKGILAHRA